MDDETRNERLDRAVAALLAGASTTTGDADLDALLSVAGRLRRLPRPTFRDRLRSELERKGEMLQADKNRSDRPSFREGFHTVTPYLVAGGAAELLDFVKESFSGAETHRSTGTAGGMHAEVRIGDSMLMIGGGEGFDSRPAEIHLYVEDADAVYRRALSAGATKLYEPMDQPYGDREGGVRDPAGNRWYIGTHKVTGRAPEGMRTVTPVLHPEDLPRQIDFLEKALGGHDVVRDLSPAGAILHATARVGDSVVELGPAQGQWGPMPAMLYLYVDDVDAWYRRAVDAGAASVQAPRDEPYGDRVAAVRDDEGNLWYMGTPIR
jgi:PhnB protein